jgi:hypothetical protein
MDEIGGDLSHFKPALLSGAPQSGTTWLQHVLGSHLSLRAPPECAPVDWHLRGWSATNHPAFVPNG